MPGPEQGRVKSKPYNWPHNGAFSPATTALVIIDMQKDFCSTGGYLDYQGYDLSPVQALIPGLQRLLAAFRKAKFPVYHTREGHRPDLSTLSPREAFRSRNNASGLGIGSPGPLGRLLIRGENGHDIIPELYPIPGEPVIDKPGRGAFTHTEFDLMLRIKGIKNLVIAGVTTDCCVSSTIREAIDRGIDCLLVEDGSAASKISLHHATCVSVREEGGIFGATAVLADVAEFVEKYPSMDMEWFKLPIGCWPKNKVLKAVGKMFLETMLDGLRGLSPTYPAAISLSLRP